MKYSTQENYRDGTVEKTTVVIRRKDAGNYDALFVGMGENGTDEHCILSAAKYRELCQHPLYTIENLEV